MRHVVVALMVAAGPSVVGASLVFADGSGNPAAVKNEDGKYYDKEGNPTFKVQSDGTVDWSALIRTSCAISMIYSSICGHAPMTPFRVGDRKSTKTNLRALPKRKTAALDIRAERCRAPRGNSACSDAAKAR